jgi:cobalt/nickel transport system ATP-binding protein
LAPLFDLRNVIFRYDQTVTALDGLTMQIEPGERIALLGANGSGKSTLLHLLDALYFAESGVVLYEGEPLKEARFRDPNFQLAFRRRVGLVFQNPDVQLFNPTVFDELAFGPLQLRWTQHEILRRVADALNLMGIAHLKDRQPHHLSGGEKKRVAIASVLVTNPEVLLLDEPTGGLDPTSQSQIIDLLSRDENARTVITATQDLDILEDIAERCYVLQDGRVVAAGTPPEILSDLSLLQRTNLVHAHRHRHGGIVHSHAHRHGTEQHEH